jgi:hypothetical protein
MAKLSYLKSWPTNLSASVFIALALPCPAVAVANVTRDDENYGAAIFMLAYLVVLGLVYVLPSIIAFLRGHANRWVIFLINVFFGATGLGWLAALIWALHKIHDPITAGSRGGESGLNIYVNDVQRVQLEPQIPTAKNRSSLESLERLAKLYIEGHISEAEYMSEKQKILKSSQH